MKVSKNHFHILKAYFKIIKKNIPTFSIYLIIFFLLTILMTSFNKEAKLTSFEQEKYQIIFQDNDNTALTKNLKSYLSHYATFTDKYKTASEINDALFAQDIEYIVKIPKGFTNDFMNDGSMQIEKTQSQDKQSSTYIELALKKYLSTAKLYNKSDSALTAVQLAEKTSSSLSVAGKVEIRNFTVSGSGMKIPKIFFGFICYGLLNIIFLGVSSIMLAYNRKEIQDRNSVSTIKPLNFNLQLFSGHIVFTLVTFVLSFILSLLFLRPDLSLKQYWLFYLNLLCVSLSILSISFFVGSFMKNRNVQNALANVISLGLSFFSGIFVPQSVMSDSVISVARFTPTYWYVKNTDDIASLSAFNSTSLTPIFISMLIQVGFAVAFLGVALIVSKQKQMKSVI